MAVARSQSIVLTKEKAKWMYQKMQEIRQFEDKVHEIFSRGCCLVSFIYMRGRGRGVGVCAHLTEKDYIYEHPSRTRTLHR